MPKLLTVIFLLFISVKVSGQTWEVGAALGGFGYMGDLNTNNPVKINQPAASVFGKYNFNGYIAAKLSFTLGNIRGADSTSNDEQVRNRNLSFYTPLRELALLAEFNFMKYIPEAGKNKYTPYVFLGAGITSYAPRTRANGNVISLRHLRTEGQENEYSTRTAVIPFGAGFKYNFTGKCTIAAELGYRYTFTDYLDDVSGVYAERSRLPLPLSVAMADRSGERLGYNIGTPGSQRGDFRPRDMYLFAGFTISYTFVTSKCYFDN
ncbi:outer membrane beta-barrel protein [Mucilaginibacter pallidiroseus]|uniref:Outer membrane beta-barrel protein n=1 Tax=Mucilaginibacter pallidiroseus TaxID=2599295 RepID=A0A563U337_9SPHI|nr:DUF6089 family protein [Mucilaginibacter pallidiroseus]TWR25758.1 outer membrane beta-barrel protein [Mucilaginibacter pallidiroseus]